MTSLTPWRTSAEGGPKEDGQALQQQAEQRTCGGSISASRSILDRLQHVPMAEEQQQAVQALFEEHLHSSSTMAVEKIKTVMLTVMKSKESMDSERDDWMGRMHPA